MGASFNTFLRFCFRAWYWLHGNVHRYFLDHIRVKGAVDVRIEDLNLRLYSDGDDGIVDALYFTEENYGEYEEVHLFKSLAEHSEVIFDIGANTGLYSIVSKLQNPEAQVYAFEPYPINIDRLKKNAELNGLENQLIIVDKALGNANEEIDFAVPEQDQISDVLSADLEFTDQFSDQVGNFTSTSVEQITLDRFVKESKLEKVDLLKIDVENYEMSVFEGALETLKQHHPIILAEIFVDDERRTFFNERLQKLGYHCYMVGKKGLFRTGQLIGNPDCRNYLFSTKRSEHQYLSYSQMPALVNAIAPSRSL